MDLCVKCPKSMDPASRMTIAGLVKNNVIEALENARNRRATRSGKDIEFIVETKYGAIADLTENEVHVVCVNPNLNLDGILGVIVGVAETKRMKPELELRFVHEGCTLTLPASMTGKASQAA